MKHKQAWGFSALSRSETKTLTHSYHVYPARFIPQLAHALIEEFTDVGDSVWDPFCGSGTLNTEAFRMKRPNLGTDINPVAVLISKAKTALINPKRLAKNAEDILESINEEKRSESFYVSKRSLNGNLDILKEWYSQKNLIELAQILWAIESSGLEPKIKRFFLCVFSSVLKRSSMMLTASVKSQYDPNKEPAPAKDYFRLQLKSMLRANKDFYEENQFNRTRVRIVNHNAASPLATSFRIGKERFDSIITSPPYVVSYDYSDIFRLSTYFLFFQKDYLEFRKAFIGTRLRKKQRIRHELPDAVEALTEKIDDRGIQLGLYQYYVDMSRFFYRTLGHIKRDGRLVMVVGDTSLRGVHIRNASLLSEIGESAGWKLREGYKRSIPVKILPTTRNKETGKFAARTGDFSERYKSEYVLVFHRKDNAKTQR